MLPIVSPRVAERVIVLGAGASVHLGYPLGGALLAAIRHSLEEPSDWLVSAFSHAEIPIQCVDAFRNELDLAIVDSIDEFIDKKPRFAKVARIMIADELLRFEDRTALKNSKSNWYYELAKLIVEFLEEERCPPVLLTFNYDLSLDEFLGNFPVPQRLRSSEETLLDKVQLLHLHGKLGLIHKPEEDCEVRRYGERMEAEQLIKVAAGIRTISELERKYTRELIFAAEVIKMAKKVMFLGFAFDQWNLDRLRINSSGTSQSWNVRDKFVGTAFKLGSNRRTELKKASDGHLKLTAPDMDLQMFASSGLLRWLKEPVACFQEG